jgi:hypothetical protein
MTGASGKVTNQGAGDRIRQPLPIENLLVYAYGAQMVHQAQRDAVVVKAKGPLAAYSSLWGDNATPVDSSVNQGFRASEDAWAIHDQVMSLRPVEVDCGHDLRVARFHALPIGSHGIDPPTGRVADADFSGNPWPTNGVLKIDLRALVMIHASRATRPDQPEAVKLRMKPGAVVWHPKRKDRVYSHGLYCRVAPVGYLPGEARQAIALYTAWREALDRLRRQVQAIRLTAFACTDVLPPPVKKVRVGG